MAEKRANQAAHERDDALDDLEEAEGEVVAFQVLWEALTPDERDQAVSTAMRRGVSYAVLQKLAEW